MPHPTFPLVTKLKFRQEGLGHAFLERSGLPTMRRKHGARIAMREVGCGLTVCHRGGLDLTAERREATCTEQHDLRSTFGSKCAKAPPGKCEKT